MLVKQTSKAVWFDLVRLLDMDRRITIHMSGIGQDICLPMKSLFKSKWFNQEKRHFGTNIKINNEK